LLIFQEGLFLAHGGTQMIGVQDGNNRVAFYNDEGSFVQYDTVDGEINNIINNGGKVLVEVQMGMSKQVAVYTEDAFGHPRFQKYIAI
jgi:hypothetical protein